MMRSVVLFVCPLLVLISACGGSNDPTEVVYGETTLVVVVNPFVNDANQTDLPVPGGQSVNIRVELDEGPAGNTNDEGVVVLAPVPAGDRTLSFSGIGVSGTINVSISDKDLREVAVAADGNGAEIMTSVLYPFGGSVIEVKPEMTIAEVNQALTSSQTIVFFHSGNYTGDLNFSGSNAILFGEGDRGGKVTLDGNVTVVGSANRIRGATITGNLNISGSDFGFSFGRVNGQISVTASDVTFLLNEFCNTVTVDGSGFTALGNKGMSPRAAPDDC